MPEGSQVIERQVFADSYSESLSTVRILKIVPRGISEESALGGLARAQVEVFDPTPWKDLNQWASSVSNRTSLSRERWIEVGGQEALSVETLDESGAAGSREVFLIRGKQGFLISSRDQPFLEELLKTIQFIDPKGVKPAIGASEVKAALNPPRVRMVYLVPSDRVPDKASEQRMALAIRELQGFYAREMDGKSFSLHDPVVEVLRTGRPVSWYTTNAPASSNAGRFWESVLTDGFALTKGQFNDPENRWIFYIDADPLCGQYVGGTSGVALVPANDLRGLTCRQNIPVCAGDPPDSAVLCRWVGGLGHELGHAFNLPHPTPGTCPGGDPACDRALMWFGYITFPNAYLLPSDKSSLLESPSTRDFFMDRPRIPIRSCTAGCAGWGF